MMIIICTPAYTYIFYYYTSFNKINIVKVICIVQIFRTKKHQSVRCISANEFSANPPKLVS